MMTDSELFLLFFLGLMTQLGQSAHIKYSNSKRQQKHYTKIHLSPKQLPIFAICK